MFLIKSHLLMKELASPRIQQQCVRFLYKIASPNYYEILNVDQKSSQKEIRNAFIELSKIHHPDTTVGATNSKEFVKILEAYQVLSKKHSRRNYDMALKGIHTVHYVHNDIIYEPWKSDEQHSEREPQPYYGIKGVNRVANWKIVVGCVIFATIGIILQLTAVRSSITFKREELDRLSREYSTNHERVRSEAETNGNAEQLARLKSRLKKSYLDNE